MKNKNRYIFICIIIVATFFSMSGFTPDFYLEAAESENLDRKTFTEKPDKEFADDEILVKFKDDVSEVKTGMECGLTIQNFNDVKVGDLIEGYQINEVKQKLD